MKLPMSQRIQLYNLGHVEAKETAIMEGDVTGTTYFTNGTRLHWGEGRSSWITLMLPNGIKVEWPVYEEPPKELEPYMDVVCADCELGPTRPATPEEEHTWNKEK